MRRFGPALARLRRERGFATAYAFYHRNGGPRMFPFTFQYYLKIEAGRSVPRPDWVPVLVSALRVSPSDAVYRELVTGYLRDLCGREETYDALVAPLLTTGAGRAPGPEAIKRLMYSGAFPLSVEQTRLLASSAPLYWTFEYLSNTVAALGPEELARRLGFPARRLASALERLVKGGLLRRVAGGRYRCHLTGRRFLYPAEGPATRGARAALRGYIMAMSRRAGTAVAGGGFIFRAEEGVARAAAARVLERLEEAAAQSVYDEREGTALYFLDFEARRVLRA